MMVTADPPRSVSKEFVLGALAAYRPRSARVHAQLNKFVLTPNLEENLANLIRDELRT